MTAPLDDPIMAEFVARLAEVNALADASPGFVWRLSDPQAFTFKDRFSPFLNPTVNGVARSLKRSS